MTYTCGVCGLPVEPNADGQVRLQGVTPDGSRAWVWGPVPVHEECRTRVTTPYDDRIDNGYVATWQFLTV